MKRWLVWDKDEGPDSSVEVDAFDAEDAAVTACDRWNSDGSFADGIPAEVCCCVSEIGPLVRSPHVVVSVTHDYSIDWKPHEVQGET